MITPEPENLEQNNLGNRLARRWIDFGRLLRRNGVETTSGQMRDLLRALPTLDLRDRESVYFASRALLCSRREDLPRFDLVFRQFWGRTRQIIIPSDTGSLSEVPNAESVGAVREPPAQSQELKPQSGESGEILVDRNTLADSEDAGEGEGEAHDEDVRQALLYSAQAAMSWRLPGRCWRAGSGTRACAAPGGWPQPAAGTGSIIRVPSGGPCAPPAYPTAC